MFLIIVGHGLEIRKIMVKERFQHSEEAITTILHSLIVC